jgi:hypothetical protein
MLFVEDVEADAQVMLREPYRAGGGCAAEGIRTLADGAGASPKRRVER